MARKVIQVPMDEALLAALDDCSRKVGRPRAEVIRAACRSYLRRREEEELDRIYEEGYRRIPEDPALGEAQAAMAAQVLNREQW